MSEVLNDEVMGGEKAGISRRRVVKGVAWTVPVLVAAVGAPPAAASPGPIVVPASVTWGVIGASSAAGAAGAITVQAPTAFEVQTGTAFTGAFVSYTITIASDKSDQNALVGITSASSDTGSSTEGKKNTIFTGTVATSPGNHILHVDLEGFNYSKHNRSGSYSYTLTLSVTGIGQPVASTLTITFP